MVRNRHHADCRVAVERAADGYTLICDGPDFRNAACLLVPVSAGVGAGPARTARRSRPLGRVDEDLIGALLAEAFTSPLERLEAIADQLEQTGTLSAASVRELRQVIGVLMDSPAGPDRRTALILADVASIYDSSFTRAASQLSDAAGVLTSVSFCRAASQLLKAAQSIAASVDRLGRHREGWDQ